MFAPPMVLLGPCMEIPAMVFPRAVPAKFDPDSVAWKSDVCWRYCKSICRSAVAAITLREMALVPPNCTFGRAAEQMTPLPELPNAASPSAVPPANEIANNIPPVSRRAEKAIPIHHCPISRTAAASVAEPIRFLAALITQFHRRIGYSLRSTGRSTDVFAFDNIAPDAPTRSKYARLAVAGNDIAQCREIAADFISRRLNDTPSPALGIAAEPNAFVPILLFVSTFVTAVPVSNTPVNVLPEITFPLIRCLSRRQ